MASCDKWHLSSDKGLIRFYLAPKNFVKHFKLDVDETQLQARLQKNINIKTFGMFGFNAAELAMIDPAAKAIMDCFTTTMQASNESAKSDIKELCKRLEASLKPWWTRSTFGSCKDAFMKLIVSVECLKKTV